MHEHLKVAGAFLCLFLAYLVFPMTERANDMSLMSNDLNRGTFYTKTDARAPVRMDMRTQVERAHEAAIDLYDMAALEHLRAKRQGRENGPSDGLELIEHEAERNRKQALELVMFIGALRDQYQGGAQA